MHGTVCLQKLDRDNKQLDEVLAKADSAAKERMSARVEFEKGEELLKALFASNEFMFIE